MRCMILVKANADTEAGVMPSEQLLADMGRYNEELVKAGIMEAGEGLHPSSRARRVSFEGKKISVVDGPFAETKELVSGFWIWKVKDLEEATEWLKRAPFDRIGSTNLEIRPVFSPEDFGKEFTPELQEKEELLRAELERQKSS